MWLNENVIKQNAYTRALSICSFNFLLFLAILSEGAQDFSTLVETSATYIGTSQEQIENLEAHQLIEIQPAAGPQSRIISLTPKGHRIAKFLFDEN